jgi:hypothetical protein
VVRRFLSQAPHARPKAHEALVLPWVTSNPEGNPTGANPADTDAPTADPTARRRVERQARCGRLARPSRLIGRGRPELGAA